ncbi:MAG: prepilin peptidase [Candidatus Paceibacterota bacterium]
MNTLLVVFSVIFGFIVGSFLNVVIYRLNTKKTFAGRSMCLSCSHTIKWYDLIPVFSYLFLRGRCRNCQSGISAQYPFVEVVTGLLFGLLFYRLEPILSLSSIIFLINYIYYGILFALLLVITVYDIRHKIIPDSLSLLFGIFAFAGLFFIDSGILFARIPALTELFSGIALSLPFALLWLVSRGQWMGLGDAKLAVGLGFMLGLPLLVPATLIAFWSGALYGLILIVLRKAGPRTEIPFAPFLVLGTLIAFIFQISVNNLFF